MTDKNTGRYVAKDWTGETISGIKVLYDTGKVDRGGYRIWLSQCSYCGNVKEIPSYHFAREQCKCTCYEWEQHHKAKIGRPPLEMFASHIRDIERQYKKSAEERNLEFTLTTEDVKTLVTGNCFYCGKPPSTRKKRKTLHGNFKQNGIDRVDNKQGYTKDNCVSCCPICNFAKGSLPQAEFIAMIERAYKHLKSKGVVQ